MLPGLRSVLLASVSLSPLTFNPSAKGASVTLSNGNMTASFGAINQGVKGLNGVSSGSYHIELKINSLGGGCHIGLVNGTHGVTSAPTIGTNAIAYRSDGQIWYNGASVATGTTFTSGDTIGIHVQFGSGVRFYKNGVAQGSGFSTLPAGGAPFFVFPYQTLSAGLNVTINQSPSFAMPSGASYWGAT